MFFPRYYWISESLRRALDLPNDRQINASFGNYRDHHEFLSFSLFTICGRTQGSTHRIRPAWQGPHPGPPARGPLRRRGPPTRLGVAECVDASRGRSRTPLPAVYASSFAGACSAWRAWMWAAARGKRALRASGVRWAKPWIEARQAPAPHSHAKGAAMDHSVVQ